MKQGGIHSSAKGFTIVETLIVLAVTGMLFVAAATLINGKQAKTQFQTAINGVPQQIRQVINEVASGYFPNNGSFSCQANSGATQIMNSAASQGTNGTCVSLGKTMQFSVGGNKSAVATYPIAGWRGATVNLDSAHPVLVAPSNPAHPGWYDDSTDSTLDGGLTVYSMYYLKPGSAAKYPIGGVAFMSSLGQLDVSGQLASGSQHLDLVVPATATAINHTALNQSKQGFANAFDINFANSLRGTSQLDSVNICFASGTTNQSGLVSISSNNLTITLTIWDGQTCS